ncbi:MAG: hypothetical protein K1X29_03975 [Bdellovibrionales bacterium]|nr:hypothetical protein [Bdellovibrionales bacterium]
MKSNQGMSLVEVLITSMLIILVIMASAAAIVQLFPGQKTTERSFNFIVARNQIIDRLIDERAWGITVNAKENSVFSCLVNQEQTSTGQRNCNGANGVTNVYDLANNLVYDFQNEKLGITQEGSLCTEYKKSPLEGDPICVLSPNIKVQALCETNPCFNPPYLFSSDFSFNSGTEHTNPNLSPMNFQLIKSGLYCPPQDDPQGLTAQPMIQLDGTNGVKGIQNAAQVGKFASETVNLLPCRSLNIGFSIATPLYNMAAANNSTRVCLSDSTNTCLFSFLHKISNTGVLSYELYQNNALYSSSPSWMTLTGAEEYQFQVYNGIVKFCVDNKCLHFFSQKLDGPFRLLIYPGWVTDTSSGLIANVNISTFEL